MDCRSSLSSGSCDGPSPSSSGFTLIGRGNLRPGRGQEVGVRVGSMSKGCKCSSIPHWAPLRRRGCGAVPAGADRGAQFIVGKELNIIAAVVLGGASLAGAGFGDGVFLGLILMANGQERMTLLAILRSGTIFSWAWSSWRASASRPGRLKSRKQDRYDLHRTAERKNG